MARSKIIKDFINSNMDIDIALQNLVAILYCLEDKALISWANKELSGYDVDDDLPEYRKLNGILMASFMVGRGQYSKRQFGVAHLDESIQESLLSTNMYSSISTLIKMKDEGNSLSKPIPPEFYSALQKNTNAHITNATVDIDVTSISDLIAKVKVKILESLLFLEKEFGNLDDLDIDISIKSTEELKDIVQHIQIKLYDNSIKIGDNNKITKSNIMTNK